MCSPVLLLSCGCAVSAVVCGSRTSPTGFQNRAASARTECRWWRLFLQRESSVARSWSPPGPLVCALRVSSGRSLSFLRGARSPNGVSARSKASSVAATVRLVGAQSTTSKTSDFRSYQGPNQGPATSLPSRPMPALPRRSASSGAADSTLASTRLGYRYAGLERFSGRPRVYEGGQPPSSSSSAASSAFCLSQGAPPLPERQALTVTTLLTNPVSLACLPRFRCHANGCRVSRGTEFFLARQGSQRATVWGILTRFGTGGCYEREQEGRQRIGMGSFDDRS